MEKNRIFRFITIYVLIILIVGCQKSQDMKEEIVTEIKSNKQNSYTKDDPQVPNTSSKDPTISVDFVRERTIKSTDILRVQITHIPRQCILVVTLTPDVDIQSVKPTPPENCRELTGFPLVHKVEPSDGTLEIRYPALILDKESYLPPRNGRDITGWIVNAYLVDKVLATPIKGPRHIGKIHEITTDEVSKEWELLSSKIDSEEFAENVPFKLLVIPGSDAGVFLYVRETGLLAGIKKEFNVNFSER